MPLSDLWSFANRSLRGALAVKMVFSAALTEIKVMGAQLENAFPAYEKFLAIGKDLGSSLTYLFADHTFHEGLLYPNESAPVKSSDI